MAKSSGTFDQFVRLNLTGEIVEVVTLDSTEITISYRGRNVVMKHHEVTHITPEEEMVYKKNLNPAQLRG
jgi:hypothetical protein